MPAADRIAQLEKEIAEWRQKNSQSNPGAMMELRDMKRELDRLLKSESAPLKQIVKPSSK
jgi:hypothetical protein